MPTIYPIPAFKDNYIWIIIDNVCKEAIVVDPGDAKPVLEYLRKNNLKLIALLITHKHADHTGGIADALLHFPGVPVYGSQKDNTSKITHVVSEKSTIIFDKLDCHFSVIEIPGHTLGHVAYYSAPYLFCGDTLFSAGCGRVFEGTAEQMYLSLQKLKSLPNDTLVFCGHEYTAANLKFASHLEPNNAAIKERIIDVNALRAQNKPTIPSTIAIEKLTNPFFRCDHVEIIQVIEAHEKQKLNSAVDVFHAMREWKNAF